jgi:hypothetical protein
MGLADDEIRIEKQYLPQALEIVRVMWPDHSAQDICLEIYMRTGYRQASVKLVYALKARLDRIDRDGAGLG